MCSGVQEARGADPMNGDHQLNGTDPLQSTFYYCVPVISTSIVLLVLAGMAGWYVHRLNREVSNLLADHLECAVACEKLVGGIRDARSELDRFVGTGDVAHLELADAVRERMVQSLDNALKWAPNEQTREMLHKAQRGHKHFFSKFMIAKQDDSPEELRRQILAMTRLLDVELLAPAQEVLTYNQRALLEHGNDSRVAADQVGLGLLALGFCGAVAGLLSGFSVARRMTQQLELRERETLRSEQLAAVGQLAAGLAHELRNPLTSMKILIQTAAEQPENASLQGCDLEILEEEIDRLEVLVRSFLDFARPPSLAKKFFDVRGLVDQTIHLISGPASKNRVDILYQPSEQELLIEADPVQIRQVLLNLLLNALNVLPCGGEIEIVVKAIGNGDLRELEIQVKDSGPGIPEDLEERIFEPFFSTTETGTGLGLAICKRIIQAHQGTICVNSGSSGGAVFIVRLPIQSNPGTVSEGE